VEEEDLQPLQGSHHHIGEDESDPVEYQHEDSR
jgi:hypothetical protein